MRNNKAILDEAARSVRRTFIGSVAGSVVMLAVVGAAGAYGMPEKLTAQAFTVAMAKFNFKFAPKPEHTAPPVEQPTKLAANTKLQALSPVSDAMLQNSVVVTLPPVAAVAAPPLRVAAAALSPKCSEPAPAPSVAVVEKTPPWWKPCRRPIHSGWPTPSPRRCRADDDRKPRPGRAAERGGRAAPVSPARWCSKRRRWTTCQTLTEMPKTEPVVIEQPPAIPASKRRSPPGRRPWKRRSLRSR